MESNEKTVKLDRTSYTKTYTVYEGICPWCGQCTSIEYDEYGNSSYEDFCDCFVALDNRTGKATYVKENTNA